MVVYIVCYSLEDDAKEQQSQLTFWLEFLNSALPLASKLSSSKWKVMVVGLRSDSKHPTSEFTADDIAYWQNRFTRLPLYKEELFAISSTKSRESVTHLLCSVEFVCASIFQAHCMMIPSSYRRVLERIQSLPKEQHFYSPEGIHKMVTAATTEGSGDPPFPTLDQPAFLRAMRYFHAIGHVVLLDKNTVCINPTVIPKVAAKFISPEEVRRRLFKKGDVALLNDRDIRCILRIEDKDNEG